MSDEQKAPDVRALEDRYQILGELRSDAGPRTYIGKRKADGADVLIRVVRSAKNDNNALAHFASDAQLLSDLDHPIVLRTLESRWLSADTIAVVNERVRGRTLDEMLSAGHVPSHQHAALILEDVRTALDWAREHGIVHRGVTPESLFFADGSDRPLVLLSPTSIPIESIPDACEDARTIGVLSWALLTGEQFDGSESADALAERRPDLARRVIDETAAMTACHNGGAVPNIANYLGVIANADALKEGEIEVARMQAELEQERRKEREAFEAEQRACEARLQETEEQLAAERVEFERRMREEEERLEDARQELAVERLQLEQERLEFDERSAELDRARAEVEAIRADHEKRVADAVAAAVAATKAEMRAQAQKKPSKFNIWPSVDRLVSRSGAALGGATDREVVREPDDETLIEGADGGDDVEDVPSKSERRTDDVSLVPVAAKGSSAVPRTPRILPPVGAGMHPAEAHKAAPNGNRDDATSARSTRLPWILPSVIVGALAVIIAIVIGVNHHGRTHPPSAVTIGSMSVVPTGPALQPGVTPRGGFLTQTASGTLAPRSMSPVLPATRAPSSPPAASPVTAASAVSPWPVDTTNVDSVRAIRQRSAALAEARRRAEREAELNRPAPRPARESLFTLPTPPSRDTFVRRDTIYRPDTFARRDTIVRRDTLSSLYFPRRDTMIRRDSVRPDTGVRPRPDTMSVHE